MVIPRLDLIEKARSPVVLVLNTTTMVLEPNPRRSAAFIVNDSDTIIYLALGVVAVLNRGIRLNAAGGAFEINSTNLFKGVINAIASVTDKNLCVIEIETDYDK